MDHGTSATLIATLILGASPDAPPGGGVPWAPDGPPIEATAPAAATTFAPDPRRGVLPPAEDPFAAGPEDPEAEGEEAQDPELAPRLLTDILVVGGVTAFHSLAYAPVRQPLFTESSFGNVLRHFARPIRSAREGWAEDDDPFVTNFVAHPLSWGIMGLYLKERGYSKGSALLFTQVHSIVWEYVIEGLYQKPSGLDLVTNFTSASVAIFALHGLSERAARREEKGVHHRILAALNPLRPFRGLFRPGPDGTVRVSTAAAPGVVGLAVVIHP